MSVKGRQFRQVHRKPMSHEHPIKAVFHAKYASARERPPVRMAPGTRQTRHVPADNSAHVRIDAAPVDEEVCAGCGLEQHVWKGNRGKGYARDGERYCCQPCADELDCACQY